MQTGIDYKLTGESRRGEISSYHYKPNPLHYGKTAHKVDVQGLKKAQQRDVISFDGGDYSSRFTIGFEVEKNQLHRNAVREYELFCGFERDGSCGYEAVTHILPLLPSGLWRNKIFDMMHKAEKIIDDRFSPSDRRCGGHCTIAVEGLDGYELNEQVRRYSGIILALFRNRLKNSFCNYNLRMKSHRDGNHFNGWHSKYQLALVKGNCLEFRVVSKFESVKQMMRRYELFFEMVNFAIVENKSFASFLKRIKPVILSMYNGDTDKAENVLKLAVHFQTFINTGRIHADIEQFIR